MPRFFEHAAAAFVAVIIMTVSFSAIVTVPVQPTSYTSAPVLA